MKDKEDQLNYGQKYAEFLRGLKRSERIHKEISEWQNKNRSECERYQIALNSDYKLKDDGELIATHPPTTAVGSFNGVVVIAANPAYNEEQNSIECKLRSERGDSYFFENFFSSDEEIFNYTSKIEWWKRVTKLSYVALNGIKDLPDKTHALWNWAHRERLVGSVDLLPFHSKKDLLTDKIIKNRDQSAGSPLDIASASMEFVINEMKPRLVIVSSATGASIARRILPTENRRTVQLMCNREISLKGEIWLDTHSYQPDWYRIPHHTGFVTHILVFPFQIFSKMTGNSPFLLSLAQEINSTILTSN